VSLREHRVALDSIEEIGMTFEVATQARACRRERALAIVASNG